MLGARLGALDGDDDGDFVGVEDGLSVGDTDGLDDGAFVGADVAWQLSTMQADSSMCCKH